MPAFAPIAEKKPPPPEVTPAPLAVSRPQPPVRVLESLLRAQGPQFLPTLVSKPIVVLDLNTGTFATLCGAPAFVAAQSWGATFTNGNSVLQCRQAQPTAGLAVICVLASGNAILAVSFDDIDHPIITSVVTGMSNLATIGQLRPQLLARVANAVCP